MAKVEPLHLYEPCTCCGGFDVTAKGDDIDDFEETVERIAKNILNGKTSTNDPALLNQTASDILSQVEAGFGRSMDQIVYNTPDFKMLNHLQQNVYSFSAAKNYQQLKDMTLSLMDGDRLRTEAEFIESIKAMNLKYNHTWLTTERNTAIAGGQMASKWVEFEQNKDDMPMLQYSTVGDSKVRDSHRALNGVTKPISDAFWKTYYPPNGWNCRCDVIQLPYSDVQPTSGVDIEIEIHPMFQTNLAHQGLIFPKGHPYFDGIPKPELRKAMAYLPPENSYKTVKGVNGKLINLHLLHNDPEIVKNLSVADDLIALGYKNIKLLPDLHEKDALLKPLFYPKGYKPFDVKKNADAWIQSKTGKNMVCDFKVLTGERNFANHIDKANLQANYAIIKLLLTPNKLGASNLKSIITHRLVKNKHLKGVIVLDKNGKLLYEQYQ